MQYPTERRALRQFLKSARAKLSPAAHHTEADALVMNFIQAFDLSQHTHIGIYLSTSNELQTGPLIQALWRLGKQVYVPVLHPFSPGHLLFLHYEENSPMTHNRYGILEPQLDCSKVMPVNQLDLLTIPLVGFDEQGNRLGMGGGYYDRTLCQLDRQTLKVIGLALDCQKAPQIPVAAWDQPLDGVLTPHHFYTFSAHKDCS